MISCLHPDRRMISLMERVLRWPMVMRMIMGKEDVLIISRSLHIIELIGKGMSMPLE